MLTSIPWTTERFVDFKKSYANAQSKSSTTFEWRGHQFVTSYAKYLIEYLEGRLK